MVTRLFLLFVFLTGGMLISSFKLYAVKMIVGILILCFMELLLIRKKKKRVQAFGGHYLSSPFSYVLYLGFSLPLGVTFLK